MEDFHQQFLIDSIKNLGKVQSSLQSTADFSGAKRQEVFRILHTIKGTAQTFGLSAPSRLAHELENILSAGAIISNADFRALFAQGIKFLLNSFAEERFEIPAQFVEEVRRVIPINLQLSAESEIFPPEISGEILNCLSLTEKAALGSALRSGKYFYVVEAGFNLKSFTVGLKKIRQDLETAGEIIAIFPGAKFNTDGEIGFQILFVSLAKRADIEKITETFKAEIISASSPENFTNDLRGVVLRAVSHGTTLAKKLGKDAAFDISAGQSNHSAETLKIVFDILLHLIRNAVDHAVENIGGKIEVALKTEKSGLRIMVADNGRGIDLEKIRAKAIEKKIISADSNLTEQATLNLIFQSELSTAPQVSEISGRGIGLDAVKNTVEKSGGKINVQSRAGKGTSFDIFLPN